MGNIYRMNESTGNIFDLSKQLYDKYCNLEIPQINSRTKKGKQELLRIFNIFQNDRDLKYLSAIYHINLSNPNLLPPSPHFPGNITLDEEDGFHKEFYYQDTFNYFWGCTTEQIKLKDLNTKVLRGLKEGVLNYTKIAYAKQLRKLIGFNFDQRQEYPIEFADSISDTIEKDNYVLRKIVYDAHEQHRIVRAAERLNNFGDYEGDDAEKRNLITAYLLVPKNLKGKAPAVLALHQHNMQYDLGKSEVVGLNGNPEQAYAHELAERGYIVLAPDSIGFEDRRLSHPNSQNAWGERYLAFEEFLQGRTLIGKNVADNIASLDFLIRNIEEVDSERIGCIGHSLGGIQTFYTAALDNRIKAAVSNCGIATITSIQDAHMCHSFSLYVPSMLKEDIDTPEILWSTSPRAFLISATTQDTRFPLNGVNELFELGKEQYTEKPENLRLNVFEGEHQFPREAREAAYDFLDEHLK